MVFETPPAVEKARLNLVINFSSVNISGQDFTRKFSFPLLERLTIKRSFKISLSLSLVYRSKFNKLSRTFEDIRAILVTRYDYDTFQVMALIIPCAMGMNRASP